jgi:dTDP-4-amino-4,6-dideoxygalactose transaminase
LRGLAQGFRTIANGQTTDAASVLQELRRRFGASEVVLTDSGTSALIAVFRKLLPAGGSIAYPAFGCIDLTAAAVRAGVRVRLYDLDPVTMSPDLDSLSHCLQRGVHAILVTHLYGYASDINAVTSLAEEYGVPVIEDAAQAAGATVGGQPAGGLADVSILSFGRGKGLTAGSGGAILSRTPAMDRNVATINSGLPPTRSHGKEIARLAAQHIFAHPLLYAIPASIPVLQLGEMVYRPADEPRSMSPVATAILSVALERSESELAHRRNQAKQLLLLIRKSRRVRPIRPIPDSEPGYLRLAVLRMNRLAGRVESFGGVRSYPMTLDEHPQLRPLLASGERAGRGAQVLRDSLFTLPTHSRSSDFELSEVSKWLARPRQREWWET